MARSPVRLSDEEPGHFDELVDHPLYNPAHKDLSEHPGAYDPGELPDASRDPPADGDQPRPVERDYLDEDLVDSLQGDDPGALDLREHIDDLGRIVASLMPPPEEFTPEDRRVAAALDALAAVAPRRPDILDALQRLSDNPAHMKREGFADNIEALAVEAAGHAPAPREHPPSARIRAAGAALANRLPPPADRTPFERRLAAAIRAATRSAAHRDERIPALEKIARDALDGSLYRTLDSLERLAIEHEANLHLSPTDPTDIHNRRIAAASAKLAKSIGDDGDPSAADRRLAAAIDTLARLAAGSEDLLAAMEDIAASSTPNRERDLGADREDLIQSLQETATRYAATAEIPEARALFREPSAGSATARLTEEAALHNARPLRGERDPREAWLFDGSLMEADGPIPDRVQAAFDEIGAAIDGLLNVATPAGYRMGNHREGLHWGIVHAIDTRKTNLETEIDKLTRQIEDVRSGRDKDASRKEAEHDIAVSNDPADAHRPATLEESASRLEDLTERLSALKEERDHFERIRDYAADMYFHQNAKVWAPLKGSHTSQTGKVASIVVEGDYKAALRQHRALPDIPEGTLIAVTSSKQAPDHHTVIHTLDRQLKQHPDMILAHGGGKGIPDIAGKWARNNGVPQIAFPPDFKAHPDNIGAAIRTRDNDMAMCQPRKVIWFTAPGERPPRLHDAAQERAIPVEIVRENISHGQETRQTPAPAPTGEPPHRQTTAEKFAAKHEAANLAEDRRREREHPWPETFTAPDRIELQDPHGRILVVTRADAPEHRNLEPAHTPAVHAPCHDQPSPTEHHARAATPDEQRTADAFLADARPAYSAPPVPSSEADHARQALPHEAAAAERFLNPDTPDPDHSSPTPEITPTRALEAIVDAALPDDIALSEDAARHNGDQRQPIKETLIGRFIGVVHSVIEGRGGTADQLSAAAAKSTELDRQNIYGELDNTQRAEHEDRSHYVADSDTALRDMHAQFTAFFEERTGKSWTPPAPDDHSGNTRYTAASAEAIKMVERIRQERAKARLPQGYPIAVTALKDATVDRQTIFERLDKVLEKRPDMFIAHGNAKGVIQDVSDWAKERGVEQVRVPIDYNLPRSQQVVKRDQRILDTVKPRGVIEITNGTEKTTALVEKARELSTGAPRDRQIPIMRINPAPPRQQERAEDTSHQRSATEQQSQGRARSAGMSM